MPRTRHAVPRAGAQSRRLRNRRPWVPGLRRVAPPPGTRDLQPDHKHSRTAPPSWPAQGWAPQVNISSHPYRSRASGTWHFFKQSLCAAPPGPVPAGTSGGASRPSPSQDQGGAIGAPTVSQNETGPREARAGSCVAIGRTRSVRPERNPIQLDRTPLWKSLRDRIFYGEPGVHFAGKCSKRARSLRPAWSWCPGRASGGSSAPAPA